MKSTTRSAQLGKYRLVAEIARGGMGVVYLAHVRGLHDFKKLVVVKELKPELAEEPKFREMFLDEARLAARLNHRNIVQTIEVDKDRDRYFFVMEYLEGRTLHAASRLQGDGALALPTVLWILCDVLAALHYAHELTDFDGKPLKVVHRDVSPRNVFLTYDGQVKLLDFGVAKAAGRDQETGVGELKGRIPFMAPEHVTDRDIDRRADIFSVGVILRDAITSKRLWEGHNEIDILQRLIKKDLPPLPEDVEIPKELRAIVTKAMAPNRDDRYPTAHAMRIALEQYVRRADPTGTFARFGDALSKGFAGHRAQMSTLIEEHLTRAESIPPAKAEVPALPSSSSDMSTGSTSNASLGSNASMIRSRDTAPTLGAPGSEASVGARPIVPSSLPPPPKPGIGTYVLSGLAFVAVVAGLTAAILSTRSPPKPSSRVVATDSSPAPTLRERPRGAPTTSASAAPPKDDRVEVTVRPVPAIAEVAIDGVVVGAGPYTAKYERGSVHTIRVSAPGYVTREETVTMTATASMNIVLEKEAGAPPPPVRRAAPAPAPRPPAPEPPPTESSSDD